MEMLCLARARHIASTALLVLGAACTDAPPTGTGDGVNLRIEALYLVQAVQTREGSVPLIAGRDAYLRVFAVANVADAPAPPIRVQLTPQNGAPQELMLTTEAASVPTSVDQSSLQRSWNVRIPGATIQTGLTISAEVDPANVVKESNEEDNHFPAVGPSRLVPVVAVPPLRIRFVPMVQAENGKTGNVNASNVESYLAFARKILPISTIDADLRAPYTVNGLGFDPQGNTWQAAVAELDAVRAAEGTDRFYYGVVNTDYEGGGVVGIAAGIPARAALGWDRFPDAPITFAHEIGHGWGRRHAPCGGAGGPDPSYPYSLGLIGAFGFDLETSEVKLPSANTDIMGYCQARFWISDYTFSGMTEYRLANSFSPPVPALVLWGRIEHGVPTLEPAFEAVTRPSLPERSGPYRIVARDASARVLFDYPFDADGMPDARGEARHFAFAVPVTPGLVERIEALELSANGRTSRVMARASVRGASSTAGGVLLSRQGQWVKLRWDMNASPLVVVRDAATGSILSLARGGEASVATPGEVRLIFSDGIRNRPQ